MPVVQGPAGIGLAKVYRLRKLADTGQVHGDHNDGRRGAVGTGTDYGYAGVMESGDLSRGWMGYGLGDLLGDLVFILSRRELRNENDEKD